MTPKQLRDAANTPWEEPALVIIDEVAKFDEKAWNAAIGALAEYESRLAKGSPFRERLLNGGWYLDLDGDPYDDE